MNALQALAKESIIVADTGELEAIEKWQPQDATTNPSLILKFISSPQGKTLSSKTTSKGLHRAPRQSGYESDSMLGFLEY